MTERESGSPSEDSADRAIKRMEERQRVTAAIDDAVRGELTPSLLGLLVAQRLGLRYFTMEIEQRMGHLIDTEIEKFTRRLIEDRLRSWEEELYDKVAERLSQEHVSRIAVEITDAFMEDLAKGRR